MSGGRLPVSEGAKSCIFSSENRLVSNVSPKGKKSAIAGEAKPNTKLANITPDTTRRSSQIRILINIDLLQTNDNSRNFKYLRKSKAEAKTSDSNENPVEPTAETYDV